MGMSVFTFCCMFFSLLIPLLDYTIANIFIEYGSLTSLYCLFSCIVLRFVMLSNKRKRMMIIMADLYAAFR